MSQASPDVCCAIAAWHAGWPEAQRTSGDAWLTQVLTPLLDDPYDAVRFIAERSTRTLPGLAELSYDFLDPSAERRSAMRTIAAPATNNALAPELIDRLLRQRDDRPVYLVE